MTQAACVTGGHDPDLWFPDRSSHATKAKAICAGCPVKEDCLQYANQHMIQPGIWGGLDRRQRQIARGGRQKTTHCRNGHEYTTENTHITKEGWRQCRTCKRGYATDQRRSNGTKRNHA